MRWIQPVAACLSVCVLALTTACGSAVAPPLIGSSQGLTAAHASVRCGRARWPVKTLSDPEAGLIKLSAPISTTIAEFVQLRAPTISPNTSRIAGVETTVYTLRADLKEMSEENDLDIHLVIADTTGQTMIAEFPSGDCQRVDH